MFFIDITKVTINEETFNVEFLCYTRVEIEEPQRKCVNSFDVSSTTKVKGTAIIHWCIRCDQVHTTTACKTSMGNCSNMCHCGGSYPVNHRRFWSLIELREACMPLTDNHPTSAPLFNLIVRITLSSLFLVFFKSFHELPKPCTLVMATNQLTVASCPFSFGMQMTLINTGLNFTCTYTKMD